MPPIAQIQSNRYLTALVLFSHKAKSLPKRSRVQRSSPSHLIWLDPPQLYCRGAYEGTFSPGICSATMSTVLISARSMLAEPKKQVNAGFDYWAVRFL